MFAERLRARLAGICALSDRAVEQLEAHYSLLCRWNRVINLTSIESLEVAVERHYCESLFLAAHLPAGPLTLADVGSGAGFPGFPIAVVRRDCTVTLIESRHRKAVFLREAARGLQNVRVLAHRSEEVKEQFDWAVSRAAMKPATISRELLRIGRRGALLGGEIGGAEAGLFAERLPLPWGERRYLYLSPVK